MTGTELRKARMWVELQARGFQFFIRCWEFKAAAAAGAAAGAAAAAVGGAAHQPPPLPSAADEAALQALRVEQAAATSAAALERAFLARIDYACCLKSNGSYRELVLPPTFVHGVGVRSRVEDWPLDPSRAAALNALQQLQQAPQQAPQQALQPSRPGARGPLREIQHHTAVGAAGAAARPAVLTDKWVPPEELAAAPPAVQAPRAQATRPQAPLPGAHARAAAPAAAMQMPPAGHPRAERQPHAGAQRLAPLQERLLAKRTVVGFVDLTGQLEFVDLTIDDD